MEQLVHPDAIPRSSATEDAISPEKDIIDPRQSWGRLTAAVLDPVSLERHHVLTQHPSAASAPFDQLRTRTLHHMRAAGHRRLALTAPTHGCGTSTVVANLALSFARQTDLKVIVFDFDLRKPSLIHIFGLAEGGPRFSALSGHRRNFESSCMRIGDSLGLSLNATPIADAAEHLSHAKTLSLLEHIERNFNPDLIIFDLPALLPMDDAAAGLALADCALLVVNSDRSTTADVDLGERTIAERTSCLGVILNKCRFADAPGLSSRG